MQASIYTTESILTSLGYPDPLVAARQQARMILLGRLARYQAAVQQLENRREFSLAELRERYETRNQEDFAADDNYLEWQWYSDAIEMVEAQLAVVSAPYHVHSPGQTIPESSTITNLEELFAFISNWLKKQEAQ